MDNNTSQFTPAQPRLAKRKRATPAVAQAWSSRVHPSFLDGGPPSKYVHGSDDYDVTSAKAIPRATELDPPERLNAGHPSDYGQWHPHFHSGARKIDGDGDEESSEFTTDDSSEKDDFSMDSLAGDEESDGNESESDTGDFMEMEDVDFDQEPGMKSDYSSEGESESSFMSLEPVQFPPLPSLPPHSFQPAPHTRQNPVLRSTQAPVAFQPPPHPHPLPSKLPSNPLPSLRAHAHAFYGLGVPAQTPQGLQGPHRPTLPRPDQGEAFRQPNHIPPNQSPPSTQPATQATPVARSFSLMSIDSIIINTDCEKERSFISERPMSVDIRESDGEQSSNGSEGSSDEKTSGGFGNRRQDSGYQEFVDNHKEPVTKGDLARFVRYMRESSTPKPSSNRGSQEEPRSRQSSTSPRKKTVVQHRPAEVLDLQGQVRIVVGRALGREEDAPFTEAMVPTKEELDRFAQTGLPDHGPSIPNLRLDVATEKLRSSKWNKRASFLFLKFFHQETGMEPDKAADKEVKATFLVHLTTLRRHYQEWKLQQNPTPTETVNQKDQAKQERGDGRRRNLLQRRADVALNRLSDDPSMQRFAEVWETMPAEAMSGDETDHSNGKLRYVVRKPYWRATEICSWLATFDALHLSTRFHSDGRAKRGKFPRPRIRNSNRTCRTKSPARGLPRNFYDPQWLASRTEFELHDLEPGPPIDLSLSPYIKRRAKRFHHILEDISKVPLDDDDPSLPEKVAAPPASSTPRQDSSRKKGPPSRHRKRARPPPSRTTRRTRSFVASDDDV